MTGILKLTSNSLYLSSVRTLQGTAQQLTAVGGHRFHQELQDTAQHFCDKATAAEPHAGKLRTSFSTWILTQLFSGHSFDLGKCQ